MIALIVIGAMLAYVAVAFAVNRRLYVLGEQAYRRGRVAPGWHRTTYPKCAGLEIKQWEDIHRLDEPRRSDYRSAQYYTKKYEYTLATKKDEAAYEKAAAAYKAKRAAFVPHASRCTCEYPIYTTIGWPLVVAAFIAVKVFKKVCRPEVAIPEPSKLASLEKELSEL
ncbi:hypothetical protein ACFWPU_00580 [Streptomyces sp. NPDC058471]|uniref:hypothetical protein n=1 Tax=Streptomyces sp. NPDC058471 TaxID=3346516 RepID=UPI00365096FD